MHIGVTVSEVGGSLLRLMVVIDDRRVVCEIMRNKEEGGKGRWIGIHLQPLIHLKSFCLIFKMIMIG